MVTMGLFYAAAALALVPTLVLMCVLLRKYTYPAVENPYFSDPSFFILFSVGMILGTILFIVYSYTMASLIYVILYSVIEVLLTVVVMNLKRYRGKSDSIFYGLGFGLGAGGSTATGFIYYISVSADMWNENVSVLGWLSLLTIALSMIFQYSSVGITVGEGVVRHYPMQFAMQAIVYNFVYWVVFTVALMNSGTELYFYVMVAASLAISVFYLRFAYTKEIAVLVKEVDAQNRKKPKKNQTGEE